MIALCRSDRHALLRNTLFQALLYACLKGMGLNLAKATTHQCVWTGSSPLKLVHTKLQSTARLIGATETSLTKTITYPTRWEINQPEPKLMTHNLTAGKKTLRYTQRMIAQCVAPAFIGLLSIAGSPRYTKITERDNVRRYTRCRGFCFTRVPHSRC